MRLRSDSTSIGYRRWWLIVPLSLVALLLAHGMTLIYRIQPAVSLLFPPSGVASLPSCLPQRHLVAQLPRANRSLARPQAEPLGAVCCQFVGRMYDYRTGSNNGRIGSGTGAIARTTFTVSLPLIKVDHNRNESKVLLDQEF